MLNRENTGDARITHDFRCPSCNYPCVVGDIYCVNCGEPLSGSYMGAGMGSHHMVPCPRCGSMAKDDDFVCSTCGYQLKSEDDAIQMTEFDSLACPRCGGPIAEDDAFCQTCGCRLSIGSKEFDDACQQSVLDEKSVPSGGPAGVMSLEVDKTVDIAEKHTEEEAGPIDSLRQGVVAQPNPYDGMISKEDVAVNVANQLVVLTRDEARLGCEKTLSLERGRTVTIRIPPGVRIDTNVDVPGLGYTDERTGEVGPLRLSFYLTD